MFKLEPSLPVEVRPDRTLRVKILDSCGLTCTFCHNEGTPVVADNRDRGPAGFIASGGRSGRVSLYLSTNGANFLPARIEPDEDYALALAAMRGALDLEEVHLTGGEPTLHPRLPELVAMARELGFTVGITSNGENGAAVIPACAKAGLDRINLSVFGTTPEELAAVQHPRYRSASLAKRKIDALRRTIDTALACGVKVSANIVVPDRSHIPRVLRLVEEHAPAVTVRLLNSLAEGDESVNAVYSVLDTLKAVPVRHILTAGASGSRTHYRLPDGRDVYFKQIRPVRLPETCRDCQFNNGRDCAEGYYGVRLYRAQNGPFMVGVCIQRMDLCVSLGHFVMSELRNEVRILRDEEYARLRRQPAYA
ncbi:hypothetical protein LI90_392 [Carbonactinospora thermoautotrophica]|uniref:Radical SAM core domain-containing protein n=1 Tax=Carbonactinospora thermoautotrophica TaxID=1469144 RepID=A0A132MLV4_9ACTN|nr:radical SAM protein [Carbonactinospora thermoautotrophica]KWW98763.1 hypothetical protein LI90_392 [Carbonactinospora thermoautotrophica]